MRLNRAESKAANKRALIEAAREVVGREGSKAKLEDIAELAGLTTGAVYSLFGGKNDLMVALVDDYTGPLDLRSIGAAEPGIPLEEVVAEVARRFLRMSADPRAAGGLLFETRVLDLVLNDPDLRGRLNASIRSTEVDLAALFTGREHDGAAVTGEQALRLARALKALLSGLGQGVVLGAHEADEEFFVETAQALITPKVLGPA
ncbi:MULTISPECIES: TetR/AcrR family transcriptional regulator [Streptosporangium]|uniref:AcrR family transcriptional regulator n=1 Tax=Streptosporangium brasiliense TaxID=47480 RepID=A0ABT9R6R9_9ACTN|nr:TetR/AcrR family transcriptional regulator [Streptosporangium brasiliense]MDP9864946.1 AcrR family transcriptional regulator [Streptosporangium brasiliense]